MKPEGARFEHDGCEQCRFVGQLGKVDVWHCQTNAGTTMLRHSDRPEDYESFPGGSWQWADADAIRRVATMMVSGMI
jgi:hypothetical protein